MPAGVLTELKKWKALLAIPIEIVRRSYRSKLYATWDEGTSSPTSYASQIRVALYNGNDSLPSWAFVDGNGPNGINNNTTQNAVAPQLTVSGNKLYATWQEDTNNPAFYASQIRVAVTKSDTVSQ
jgi:hypothetical protein